MQGKLKYVKGLPTGPHNRVVGVYSVDQETHPELSPVPDALVYGLRRKYREEAPEWMKPYITMLDLADDDETPTDYCFVLPGVGYRGSSWYVVIADKKYAEEAGLDVSDLLTT